VNGIANELRQALNRFRAQRRGITRDARLAACSTRGTRRSNAAISSSSTDPSSLVLTAIERLRWTSLFERRSRSRRIRYTANTRSRQGSAP
jgi:hypothetical protein